MNTLPDSIAVLGSTGSVGLQTLDVAARLGIRIDAMTAASNDILIEEQVRRFRPRIVALSDERSAVRLRTALRDTDTKVYVGGEGIVAAASETTAPIVCNSIAGVAGLLPTLAAIQAGKNIALANKETLVTGGQLVMREAEKYSVRILPTDSEHSAIFQCLSQRPKKLILTCSGGPFFGYTPEQLYSVTREQALAHPTWKMGEKITIDCATLMNKGFEVIEAAHLFGMTPDDIEVVIHRESVIHSMVVYPDNAVIAQLSVPDMRLCIQYALTYPLRTESPVSPLDFSKISKLTFFEPDTNTFTPLRDAVTAFRRGGAVPAALVAADERAVCHFMNGRISMKQLLEVITHIAETFPTASADCFDDLFAADREARAETDRCLSIG